MRIWKKMAAVLLAGALAFTPVATHINVIDTYAASTISMSSYTCSVTDLRTGASKTFGGNNGALILYGPSWDQVGEVVEVVNNFIECTDIKNFDYFYLGSGNDSDIVALANKYNFNSKICAINVSTYSKTDSFFSTIYGNYVGWGNRYTPPLVIYVDPSGNVYDVTQGSLSIDKLMDHMTAMGIETNFKSPFFAVDVEGELLYDTVAQILKRVNEARAAVGRDPLSLDKGLMEAAMQRAAECAVYYDHTRPDLTSCFAIFPEYSGSCGENIAVGYRSADAVMDGWIKSSGHYANIINTNFKSIGIGAFYYNGQYYWAQSFGTCTPHAYSIESNCSRVYSVACDSSIVTKINISKNRYDLEAGDTATISLTFTSAESWSGGKMRNSSFNWTSSSGVAAVDANGVITAKKPGTATITGVNKLKDDVTVTITVNVAGEPEPAKNGIFSNGNGEFYYYKDDVVQDSYTGLVANNGIFWYVVNGKVKTDYKGFVTNSVATWYVVNGKIDTSFTGLGYDETAKKWYGVIGGKVDMNYTGLVKNAGYFWYVKNGVLDTGYTGFFTNDAGIWYVSSGKIDTEFTGLGYDKESSEWLCVKNGRYYPTFTGIVQNAGVYWYVYNGHLAVTYKGLVNNEGANWYVVTGRVATNYTGNYTDSNGIHKIVNGKEV